MHPTTFLAGLFAVGAVALPAPVTEVKVVEARQFGGGSSTANDIKDGGACKQISYIFARGTSEGGNIGSTVGPAFAKTLKSAFGENNVAVQGVEYPADVAGTVGGQTNPAAQTGSKNMASLAQQVGSKCPDTKIVLSGYSQGAQQVHGALINLGAGNKVAAAVTFGDPLKSQAFKNIDTSKTKIFCNAGDSVCNGQFIITAAHLSYPSNSVQPAADFVKSVVG